VTCDRVAAAASLLAVHAPVHLRWLQRAIVVIFVSPQRGGGWIQLVPEAGILRLTPLLVWQGTTEQVALELAAAATRFRFHMAGVRDEGQSRLPIARRAILERIWLAERLQMGESAITEWKGRLLTAPARRSSLTTTRHLDA
jgi:hypothetical protein